MISFLSQYWPYLVAFLVLVVILALIRGVRKFLREGGGAFRLSEVKKYSEPNKEVLKEKSKALLQDADIVCEVKNEQIVPGKEALLLFRQAVSKRFKVAMFLIPDSNQVVYFFCKTEAGIKRRIENLMPNHKRKSNKWPYMDTETGKKLKFPKF